LFKENSRKSPLDIKIASYLYVKVLFQEFNRRRDSFKCLGTKIARTKPKKKENALKEEEQIKLEEKIVVVMDVTSRQDITDL